MERMEPFNVIYQTAEDGLGDTVKPRLIEAGADLDRVLVIDDSEVQLTLSDERIEKGHYQSQKYRLEDKLLTQFPADIQQQRAHISALKTDAETAAAHPQDKENFCGHDHQGHDVR